MPSMPTKQLDTSTGALIDQMLRQYGQGRARLYALFQVGESGSLYEAARILGLSGIPVVRNRIRTLEAELDLALLVTESNCSRITPEGWAVIELVRPEFAGK